MSKHNRRPEATRPAPQTEKPEATKTPEAIPAKQTKRPDIPPLVVGMARTIKAKWGVPEWLTIHAAFTGSAFHKSMPGTNNACGLMSTGTMPKNQEGWAWFGNVPIAYDQFGFVCHKLGLDYSKPEACVRMLKTACPKIDTESYTIFKEA